MTKSKVMYTGTMLFVAQALLVQACGSNTSTTPTGTGGTTTAPSAGGSTTVPSTGGTTTPATGAGGAAGGTTGTAGSTGTFTPLCTGLTTAAGAVPGKGVACVAADPQLCYKNCGPESKGFKAENCSGGTYVESSTCSYPAGDYSCYKIPATVDATCPTTAPKASDPCTVAQCILCSVNGGYLDSTGTAKTGYCVCQAPNASGVSKWSCASTTAWPCPGNTGC